MKKRKIGLALGSGSARGMSHIGVIRALQDMGIEADVIAGCSVGSMVGASYASSKLELLEEWALSMTESKIRQFLSINFRASGFVNSKKLKMLFEHAVGIESLKFKEMDKTFAAVSTDLSTGQEVWLKKGSVHDALWASMAFPGLFPSVKHDHRWLVDGGLVNPVPVSLCRAMGADVVIAVNLNADIINSYDVYDEAHKKQDLAGSSSKQSQDEDNFWEKTKSSFQQVMDKISTDDNDTIEPSGFDVISNSIHIMSSHLTRSRLVGDPPDVLLQPRLNDVGLLQIHKAKETMAEGRACVERMKDEINFRLDL